MNNWYNIRKFAEYKLTLLSFFLMGFFARLILQVPTVSRSENFAYHLMIENETIKSKKMCHHLKYIAIYTINSTQNNLMVILTRALVPS